jgi:hypothetical protein
MAIDATIQKTSFPMQYGLLSMRLNMQISMIVENEAEGKEIYDQVKVFADSIKVNVMTSANVTKMLSPCCGGKKT